MDLASFTSEVGRVDVEMVRREAVEGRFGPVQDAAVEKYWNPRATRRAGRSLSVAFPPL